jgi:hypothetical protein
MQATISGKRFDIVTFVVGMLIISLLVAVAIAVASGVGQQAASTSRPAALTSIDPTTSAWFLHENLYLPTGRIASAGPSYADFQFAEQNAVLPAAAAVRSLSYADFQFAEQNLAWPASISEISAVSYATMRDLEQNLHLPSLAPTASELATLALIEQNSWGASFSFTALPGPGTLPQPSEGAVTY